MRATYNNGVVELVVSERNLLALLAHLRDPNRAGPALTRAGLPPHEPTIIISAETDDVHYAERMGTLDEPIPMQLRTEELMDEIREELA